MQSLLILQTAAAKNPTHLVASDAIRQNYDITTLNYPDIVGFNGSLMRTADHVLNLDDIDKIWLEFDWELSDNHINYHHITRLIIAEYADKLVVNKRTFQKFHPDYDDKLFLANLLHYAHVPHPATRQLSHEESFDGTPTVVKKRFSGRARDVYLVHQATELDDHVLAHAHDYIRQDYMDIIQELRVIVYRDAVIGAVEKSSKFSGGNIQKVKILDKQAVLDDEQTRICLETARALESELLGIDLAIDATGDSWIVEANVGANLTRFTEVTGIDLISGLLLDSPLSEQ